MVSPLKPWLQSVVDSDSRRRHGRLVSPLNFLHFHHLGCKRSWCIGNSHRNLQARPRDDVYVTQTLADGQSFNINRRAGDPLGVVVCFAVCKSNRWNVHYKNKEVTIKTLHRNRTKRGGLDYLLGLLNYSGYWSDFSSLYAESTWLCLCEKHKAKWRYAFHLNTMRHTCSYQRTERCYILYYYCVIFSRGIVCAWNVLLRGKHKTENKIIPSHSEKILDRSNQDFFRENYRQDVDVDLKSSPSFTILHTAFLPLCSWLYWFDFPFIDDGQKCSLCVSLSW